MIYPWQKSLYEQLWSAYQSSRLSHALLITGLAGVGKYDFAIHFIQALLCQRPSTIGDACGDCSACRTVINGSHPDILHISPHEHGHAIKVDQIRAISDFVYQSSMQGGSRIVLIHPAHCLNVNAANALLKTLEEPAPDAIIILLSDQYGRLPVTIRSRCQRYHITTPKFDAALAWLKANSGTATDCKQLLKLVSASPLAALSLLSSESSQLAEREALFKGLLGLIADEQTSHPVELAAAFQQSESLNICTYLMTWLMDIIRLQVANNASVINEDYLSSLTELSIRAPSYRYLSFVNYIQRIQRQLSLGINFNKPLLLEDIFIRWQECIACS